MLGPWACLGRRTAGARGLGGRGGPRDGPGVGRSACWAISRLKEAGMRSAGRISRLGGIGGLGGLGGRPVCSKKLLAGRTGRLLSTGGL